MLCTEVKSGERVGNRTPDGHIQGLEVLITAPAPHTLLTCARITPQGVITKFTINKSLPETWSRWRQIPDTMLWNWNWISSITPPPSKGIIARLLFPFLLIPIFSIPRLNLQIWIYISWGLTYYISIPILFTSRVLYEIALVICFEAIFNLLF